MKNKKGFTLLELLIVVLIIGILAAISLPQYRRIITKSKATQMEKSVASIAKAAQRYYLSQGVWANSFGGLDIDYAFSKTDESVCLSNSAMSGESFQKDDLEFIIHKGTTSSNIYNQISVRFAKGPYKCTGFSWFLRYDKNPSLENKLLCYERTTTSVRGSKNQKGDFCEKVMGYKLNYDSNNGSAFYYD